MESGFALTFSQLQGAVGHFLGWGRGADQGDTKWTDQQLIDINECVLAGLARFYRPAPLEGETVYDWSFLKPVASLTLASGASVVALPDDYSGHEGQITLAASGSNSFCPIDIVGVGTIYGDFSRNPTLTGRPLRCCVEPLKGTENTRGQRFQLKVFPAADAAYTLQVQYYIIGEILNSVHPYPYGGAAHADTIKAACIAAAEEFQDDARGVRWVAFQERLAASIGEDRKKKPQKLGYNRDNSDSAHDSFRNRHWWGNPITIGGVTY